MAIITENVEHTVQFNEVDSMGIVWHGNYIKYFEAARSEFCLIHGIDAADFRKAGILAPVSRIESKFKAPLEYQDRIRIEAECTFSTEPKLVFLYRIFRLSDNRLTTTGRSEQLFIDPNCGLLLEQPPLIRDFFTGMKQRSE